MPVSPALKEAQDKYKSKLKNNGLTRVTVWIPKDYKKVITDAAAEMRVEFDKQRKIQENEGKKHALLR